MYQFISISNFQFLGQSEKVISGLSIDWLQSLNTGSEYEFVIIFRLIVNNIKIRIKVTAAKSKLYVLCYSLRS